jgi:molybdopterin-guanine dinucleotide biosynthesis protein A
VRPLPQGAARLARARAHRRARIHRGVGRSGAAAGIARLIGAIVAGGEASRFAGAAKGLHTVGGVRIIDRVARAVRTVASELILVSNSDEAARWLADARVVGDVRAERGSLVGLHTALTHTPGGALVVAWDMPFVSAELLALLRDASNGTELAVIPEGPSGLEPLCAFYSSRCLRAVEAALDTGDFRLGALIERLPSVRRIPRVVVESAGDPAMLFFNVNSAADLAVAESMARRGA